jgi:SAM-dependent methyltransferase
LPNPALVDLLSERQDLVPLPETPGSKKALVPGCGKGYDVLLLAAFGYDAYGLEVSQGALQAARKHEVEAESNDIYTVKGKGKGNVKWLSGDFFKDDFKANVDTEAKFDLIYDYTVSSLR